jgi:hypothetical protein
MAYSRRNTGCGLLALLLAAAALAMPPCCYATKWVSYKVNKASLLAVNSGGSSLSMEQTSPATKSSVASVVSTRVSLQGTLISSGAQPRRIKLIGSAVEAGALPPPTVSLHTPEYQLRPKTTTLTARARAMQVNGCVQNLAADGSPVGSESCINVLLDMDWAARGVLSTSVDRQVKVNDNNYRVKPATRTSTITKSVSADYRSTDMLSVHVVAEGSKEELFTGSFDCSSFGSCLFTVVQEPVRVLTRS